MSRYVDVTKIKFIGDTFNDDDNEVYVKLSDVKQAIDQTPTADVVEVVRCRDCKHFTRGMSVGMCLRIKDKPILPCVYNHFCSFGERK